ncbi:MAG: cation transporter [Marinicaulis sp.]|nr:cation transporter [Marinicaulis sp.]
MIVVFMIVEIIGGVISGSLALLADASHMFTDAFALALAASAQILAARPADKKLHFGYRRAQVLAAFVNGILMTVLLIWIVWEAVRRFANPIEINAPLMLGVAIAGLLANAVAFLILHQRGQRDLNMRGALLHVVGDLLGSAAAIIAAIVIALTGWTQIDPLLSLVVAFLIGLSALRLIREAGFVLLEGAPTTIDVAKLSEEIPDLSPSITGVHRVQISQITPEHPRLTMHLNVAHGDDIADALATAKRHLAKKYNIRQSTIQVEIGDECPDREFISSEGFGVTTVRADANDEKYSGNLAVQKH